MKYLVIGDVHIEESALSEIDEIFSYILTGDFEKIDKVVLLGDYFDKKKPSPAEVLVGTRILASLALRFNEVIIVSGNHDRISNNLTTLDYARFVSSRIRVYDEFIENNVFFGHFFTDKSNGYGAKDGISLDKLGKYSWVILGHQHDFQEIYYCRYHLGSIRYVSFGENPNIKKYYAVLDTEKKSFGLFQIAKTIPILDVYGIEDLDKIDPDTKVRIIYKDFTQFKKEVNFLYKYKDRFIDFKIKLDFARSTTPNQKMAITVEENKLETLMIQWLETIKDSDVKDLLDIEFTKEL